MRAPLVFLGILLVLQFGATWGEEPPALVRERLVSPTYGRVDKTVKILCPVEGMDIHVQWFKDGKKFDLSPPRSKKITSGIDPATKHMLRIKALTKEDAGLYLCKAVNGYGSAMENITLTVLSGNGTIPPEPSPTTSEVAPEWLPSVTPVDNTITVVAEETLNLNCDAKGTPMPNIRWFINDTIFHDNTKAQQLLYDYKLRHPLMKKQFQGSYKCIVKNEKGQLARSWQVQVIEKEPTWEISPTNITVKVGDQATFTCKINSANTPKIAWFKEDSGGIVRIDNRQYSVVRKLEIAQRLNSPRSPHSSTYHYYDQYRISNTQPEAAGVYACAALIQDNQYKLKEAHLTVLSGLPSITTSPQPTGSDVSQIPMDAKSKNSKSSQNNVAIMVVIPTVVGFSLALIAIYFYRNRQTRKRLKSIQKHNGIPKYRNNNNHTAENQEVVMPLTNGANYSNPAGRFSSLNSTYSGSGSGGGKRYPGSGQSDPRYQQAYPKADGSGHSDPSVFPPSNHPTLRVPLNSASSSPQRRPHLSNYSQSSDSYESRLQFMNSMERRHLHQTSAAAAAAYNDSMETESHFSSVSTSGRFDGARPQMPTIHSPPLRYSPPPAPPGSVYSTIY